jgi:hypothetical protein
LFAFNLSIPIEKCFIQFLAKELIWLLYEGEQARLK